MTRLTTGRARTVRWGVLLVLIAWSPLAMNGSETPSAEQMQTLAVEGRGLLESRIAALGGPLQPIVFAAAYLLLLSGLVQRLARHEPGGDLLAAVGGPLLCAAAVAAGPDLASRALDAGRAAAMDTGYYGAASAHRAVDFAEAWLPAGSPVLEAVGGRVQETGWLERLWQEVQNGVGLSIEAAGALWGLLLEGPRGAATLIVGAGVGALLLLGSVMLLFAEFFQTAVFSLGTLLLPVGIAGLSCGPFSNAARGLLMKLGGVALWPLGWACSNLVTFVILEVVFHSLHGAWEDEGAGALLNLAGFLPTGVFAFAAAGIFASLVWMISSLVGVPFLVARLVAGGTTWVERTVGNGLLPATSAMAPAASTGPVAGAQVVAWVGQSAGAPRQGFGSAGMLPGPSAAALAAVHTPASRENR